jgi:hypothetical protein
MVCVARLEWGGAARAGPARTMSARFEETLAILERLRMLHEAA